MPALVRSRYTAGLARRKWRAAGMASEAEEDPPGGAPRWIMAVMTDQIEALLEGLEAADPGDAPEISDRLVDVLGDALDPDPDGAG